MDLAEEEHRLRDEWVTYWEHGFRLKRTMVTATAYLQPAATPPLLTTTISALLVPPPGADPQMADDARRWAVRWMNFIGQEAAGRLVDPLNFRPAPYECGDGDTP